MPWWRHEKPVEGAVERGGPPVPGLTVHGDFARNSSACRLAALTETPWWLPRAWHEACLRRCPPREGPMRTSHGFRLGGLAAVLLALMGCGVQATPAGPPGAGSGDRLTQSDGNGYSFTRALEPGEPRLPRGRRGLRSVPVHRLHIPIDAGARRDHLLAGLPDGGPDTILQRPTERRPRHDRRPFG